MEDSVVEELFGFGPYDSLLQPIKSEMSSTQRVYDLNPAGMAQSIILDG